MVDAHECSIVPLRPLRWRDLPDGTLELHDPARDEWARLAPWTRHVLRGLEANETLDDIYASLASGATPDPAVAPRVRRFIHTLSKVGYVEIRIPMPERFAGRYEVVRELGRGGVGIAYECRDARDGSELVVKRAWGFLNRLEAARAALRHEADALRALGHPGIARFHEAFEQDGTLHPARELVHGEPLSARHDGTPASAAEARRVLEAAADGIMHLHARGFLLLDYKPGNFFVERGTNRVILMDVGHCEPAPDGEIALRAARGTPAFVPPEIARERRASTRSDVWGLGRLHAFLRTGRLFRRAHVGLDEVLDGLAEKERDAVARVCAHDPAHRPGDILSARTVLVDSLVE